MKLPANFLISLVGVLSVTRLGLGAPLSEPSAVLARSPEAKMTKDQMCEILENNSLFDGHSCDEFFLTLRDRPKNKVSLIDLYVRHIPYLVMNSEMSSSPPP